MTTVINKLAACAAISTGLSLLGYLQYPRPATNLSHNIVYHGTDTSRMQIKPKDRITVGSNGLFFHDTKEEATDFARTGISFYRPDDLTTAPLSAHPILVELRPLDPSHTIFKKGLFGGVKYFPSNTQVVIENVTPLPPVSMEEAAILQAIERNADLI